MQIASLFSLDQSCLLIQFKLELFIKAMVAFSKSRRSGLLSLALSLLALATLTSAQLFANLKYDQDRQKANNFAFENPDAEESAVNQLDQNSSIWDLLAAHQKDFLNLGGLQRLKDQLSDVYSLLSNDPETRRQRRNAHRKNGAMRSGQGDEEQARQLKKKLQERERIESMLENGEVAKDIPTANRIYEMWLEKLGEKPGLRRDEKHDLKPHATVMLHAEDIVDEPEQQQNSRRPRRNLRSEVNGADSFTVNRLEEIYPTECYNQGKLAKQTQKYYMCKSLASANSAQKASEPFRVTSETYQMLLTNYTDQYSCYTQNVETNVCVCPGGYMDALCGTELYTKCYINITTPAFYEGCENKFEDSFYYLYSIPGFSPCFWYNFNETIDVAFSVVCQKVNEDGLTTPNRQAQAGYPYRDVIREPNVNTLSQVSSQPETEFAVDTVDVTVNFDFRDMKYLSHYKRFFENMKISKDGITNGTIVLDFSQLQSEDASGQSRYIVGGRTFFEASVFAKGVSSFTFRGFFDEDGYEEPKSTLNELKSSGWLYVIIAACILVVIGAIGLYCYCAKKKQNERAQKKHKNE